MSKKKEKVILEITKTKEKISEFQTKLRELERQKTELENTEIVELVRSTKMNTSELSEFLKAYREKMMRLFSFKNRRKETMKKINIRIYAALFAVILCLLAFPITALADGGEEVPLIPEESEMPKTDPAPLTPDDNLTLVDDISEEQAEDKQFVTLVSKNGNYFYLVIDRAGDKENVYFLNLVDEADLLALIERETIEQPQVSQVCNCTDLCEDGKVDPNCSLCRNDLTKCTGKTTTHTPEPETTEEKGNSAGSTLLILLIVGIAGGGFYYFKVLKNKGNTKGNTLLDEYDFEDDEDYDDEYEYEIEDEDEEDESEDI